MLHVRKRRDTYQLIGTVRGDRIRLTLGTRHQDAAVLLSNKIERALAEGQESPLWPELATVLPAKTSNQLAAIVGYVPKPQPATLTWDMLVSAFTVEAEQRIARSRMARTTWARYQQTIREFSRFLNERHISALEDIRRSIVEQFKACRLECIKLKKFSRGGGGLALDVAILHCAFSYAIECEMVARNPVKPEGRPGDNPEGGAQPFRTEQLGRLRESAGPDILSFLLERHTGFRGGDAVSVCWDEIDWQAREFSHLTQKRRKRVIVPIHPELLFALEAEFAKRRPRCDEPILLNPETGRRLTRPRLYERMKALGRRAQVSNVHPHRFRDTFAVDMLLKGASVYEVAKLLGDTVETVERHYAPWVRELRERARRIMETGEGLEQMAPISESTGTKMTHSEALGVKPN